MRRERGTGGDAVGGRAFQGGRSVIALVVLAALALLVAIDDGGE